MCSTWWSTQSAAKHSAFASAWHSLSRGKNQQRKKKKKKKKRKKKKGEKAEGKENNSQRKEELRNERNEDTPGANFIWE